MNDNPCALGTVDDTEGRLRAALHARSAQVTEESLRLPVELPEEGYGKRRWPLLAAAAAAAVAIGLGAVLVIAGRDQGIDAARPPEPRGPAEGTSVEHVPMPPFSSPRRDDFPADCPGVNDACTIQFLEVNGEPLELSGRPAREMGTYFYRDWEFRVAGGDVIGRGSVAGEADHGSAPELVGHVNNYVRSEPLKCVRMDGIPICLLDTYDRDGSNEAYVATRTSSGWRFENARFGMPSSKESIDVREFDGGLAVVAVEHDPNRAKRGWSVRVWQWDGTELGCPPPADSRKELPFWPNGEPDPSVLRPTNCLSR